MGYKTSYWGQNGFSQFGELQGSSSSNTWDATIGVIAHELGHAYFGLPDLYDTSNTGAGIGAFGLMGTGTWGYKSTSEKAGETPVHFSAWSKENLNICTPQTVSSGTDNYTLATNATTCGIYKIPTSTTGEYFLIENRGPAGYDRGFIGLLLDNDTNTMAAENFKGGLAMESFINMTQEVSYVLSIWRPVAKYQSEVMENGLPFLRGKAKQYRLI